MCSRLKGMWWGTGIEALDPGALAAFYSELLGWPVVHQEPGTAILKPPQGSMYMGLPARRRLRAASLACGTGQQRTMMHLDIQVADLGPCRR